MPEVAELGREELVNYIASVRGDQVAILMEIASEDELKTYLQSLVRTAELLGEGIPGLVDPPPEEDEEGEDDEGAAAEAPAETSAAPSAAPARPAQDAASPAQPATPQQPAGGSAAASPANVDALRQQVMGLLKELAAETKTASPQQLGALRLALRIAKAKMHAEGG